MNTYPSSSLFEPWDQVPTHKFSQTVHYGVHHDWMALTHTVHRQPGCYSVDGHHFAPCDPLKEKAIPREELENRAIHF